MKKTRKLIALLLALVMAMTAACISVFAAHKKQYQAYTFFGDSVTAASGIPAYYEYFVYNEETGKIEGTAEGQRVRDSYPDLVAQGVGINNGLENYYNESHSGWRTSEVRQILDESYVNEDGAVALALSRAMANGKTISDPEELRPQVREEIAKSDLITLDLGSNDIQLPIIMALYAAINPANAALYGVQEYDQWLIEELLQKYGTENELIAQLAQTVAAIHGIEYALEVISKATITGLHKFRVNYPVIIEKIREINPNADIYVIGLYNPLSDTLISEQLPIPIGKVLDPMIQSMNLYLAALNPARRYYTYVDAFNTAVLGTINVADLFSSESGLSAEGMGTYTLYVHPSVEGHRYIADQVLKAIPDAEETPTSDPANETVLNGIVKGPDGKWAMYKDGKVDTSYTGIAKNEYGWWRVENGYVNFNANSIYKNEYGWWKCTDGKVTFDENGIYKNEYGWWKTTDSKVTFKENSIYKNEYGWWKTTDSKVTFKETGIFSNQYGKWYVKDSKVDFNKNGKVKFNGKTYTVKNGKATA